MAKMGKAKVSKGVSLSELDIKAPEQQAPEQEGRSLRERAMLVRSTVSRWYGTGADEEVVDELREAKGATGEIGSFTKRFMSRSRLSKINNVTHHARQYHKSLTLPWGDGGLRLLSVQSFFAYKKKMAAFERDFYIAVEEFLAEFPAAVESEKARLGDLWKARDYPDIEQLRTRFRFAVLVEPLPSSDDFRLALSKDEAEEVRREYEREVRVRMKDAVQDVFTRVQETVSELQKKLASPDASLRAGSFESLRKLAGSLPQLNSIVQDPHIRDLGNQIARDLLAVDVGAMKKDPALRSEVKSKADKVLAALKPLQQSWRA